MGGAVPTVRRSLIELNLSLLVLSFSPLFAKWVRLNAVSLIFWRAAFGAAALLLFLRAIRQPLALGSRREYLITAAVGVLMALHFVTYFHAIQVSTVAVAVTAVFSYPAMTVLIEPLLYGERPRWLDLGLALAALLGVALIVPSASLADATVQGVLWGLLSALLFALRNVSYRRWLHHVPGSQVMLYQLLVIAAVLAPFIAPVTEVRPVDWALLAVLGVVCTALGHSLFAGSMRQLKAKTASLIACLQPVYAIVLGIVFLAEQPSARTLLGAAVVLGVALVESRRVPASPR